MAPIRGFKRASSESRKENFPTKKPKRSYFNHNHLPKDNLTAFNAPKDPIKAVPVSAVTGTSILVKKDTNIIRSSQAGANDADDIHFNIRTPRKLEKRKIRTPRSNDNSQLHSSDDNIFWAVTPTVHKIRDRKNISINQDDDNDDIELGRDSHTSMPSSPLKNELTMQSNQLLDPTLQSMVERYGSPTINSPPILNRAVSDPNSSTARKQVTDQLINNNTPIIATRESLSESMLQSINKLKASRKKASSAGSFRHPSSRSSRSSRDSSKQNVSQLLQQIGNTFESFSVSNSQNSKKCLADKTLVRDICKSSTISDNDETRTTKPQVQVPEKQNDSLSSDTFDDDFDMNEIDKIVEIAHQNRIISTQATPASVIPITSVEQQQPKANSKMTEDSEDEFSDDGADIIELLTQQRQEQQTRPPQPQTAKFPLPSMSKMDISSDNDDAFSDDDENDLNALISKLKTQDPTKKSQQSTAYKDMKLENDLTNKVQDFSLDENCLKTSVRREDCFRFQILNILKTRYKRQGVMKDQIILTCKNIDEITKKIVIRDDWLVLDYCINDIIHVITDGSPGANPQLVDKDNNLIIWNPDILLSATTIADAVSCPRESVIKNRFSGPGEYSLPMLVGNIVHALFQKCLATRDLSDEFVNEFIEEQLYLNSVPILTMDKELPEFKEIILQHFMYIKEWITTYLPPLDNSSKNSNFNKPTEFKATNVLDIEENIMAPIFGLRGLIDVVIEARLGNGSKIVVPMEIKTGRDRISNKGQVSLYTLLVRERYGVDNSKFSLVYTKMHQSYFYALQRNELKQLINIRNDISQYMKYDVTKLPKVIQDTSKCERCFTRDQCMTLHKLVEDGTSSNSGLEESLFESITGHLKSPVYKQFYTRWNDLLTKEEGLINLVKRDQWKFTSKERELSTGKCIGGLSLVKAQGSPKTTRSYYQFERDINFNPPLTAGQLSKYDRISLSDEDGHFGLAFGFIELISPDFIIISTDRKFLNSAVKLPNFDSKTNQIFKPVLNGEVPGEIGDALNKTKYRIDKDDAFHGLKLARFNLLNLFMAEGDIKRRKLIVDLEKPKYSKTPIIKYKFDESKFNSDQLKAFDKVLKTEDYSLILGMPGTGKTTVIANLIKALVENKKTVLICSYTHSAVDNIVEKLIGLVEDLSLFRVGYPSRISSKVRKFALNTKESIYPKPMKTKEDFEKTFMEPQIVASTCLAITDDIFIHRKTFDYCIVDEASQVAMPVVLGPLALADKFILVGDHYQLPPLITNPEAKNGGLDKSLFRILSECHPQSVVELTHQYRMCSDVMLLSNKLIYDGRLKCGSTEVGNQTLHIPFKDRLYQESVGIPKNLQWLNDVFNEENRVLFLNHDNLPNATEVISGDKVENYTEAKLIIQISRSLMFSGVAPSSIGIMSFYRAQLKNFHKNLIDYPDIEILTADQYQGRDKDCIIISLVRSNEKNNAGSLLNEWRRVNVAMTRSKCKLIIVGSKKLMDTIPQFEGFMELFEKKHWIYDLPCGADTVYRSPFGGVGTGVTVGVGSSGSSGQGVRNSKSGHMTSDDWAIHKNMLFQNIVNGD